MTSLRGLMLQMTEQRRKRLLWSTAFCGFWALAACVLPSKIERAKVLIVIERTSEETDYPRNRQFSSSMLQEIKEQSSLDAELNALKEMIHAGWPAHIQQFPTSLKPYWPYRDELATEDRIVMKAHRIIIPATLQKEILTKLHAPHQGTERTKLRARTSVYWRGLYKDIEETTKTCSTSEELQHNQQKEPLITT